MPLSRLRSRASAFVSLGGHDRRALIEASTLYWGFVVASRLGGSRSLRRALGPASPAAPAGPPTSLEPVAGDVRLIARTLAQLGQLHRDRPLALALTGRAMLSRRGLGSTMLLGVRAGDDGRSGAHAWLTHRGWPVTGGRCDGLVREVYDAPPRSSRRSGRRRSKIAARRRADGRAPGADGPPEAAHDWNRYIDALVTVHETLLPTLYLEVGTASGASLAVARCRSIAIDPALDPDIPRPPAAELFRETSDEFFSRADVCAILEHPVDLGLIDGMHLVEFALRDISNLERHCAAAGVILVDDVLPGRMEWATRTRSGREWTGDVYRLVPLLREHRPDLRVEVFDVAGKGLAVVSNLDPTNRVLVDRYDALEARLRSGEHVVESLDALHRLVRPRPARALPAHLRSLANRGTKDAVETRHLELVKRVLLNEIRLDDELARMYLLACVRGDETFDPATFADIRTARPEHFERLAEARHIGRFYERKIENVGMAHTMIGRARLDSLHECLDHVRVNDVPGDLMECGVWRGGACVFMAEYVKTHALSGRTVFAADSFRGLPVPTHAHDAGLDLSAARFPELAVSVRQVQDLFERYDVVDDIVVVEGWFAESLDRPPTTELALLRLDGDLYSSTLECLSALYDLVAPGGVVIVDDYGALASCRAAVNDFFAGRGEALPHMQAIDWTGVYWLKDHRGSGS